MPPPDQESGPQHADAIPSGALREITPMPPMNTQTFQIAVLAVVGMVALVLLVQAIVLLALFSTVRKALRSLREDFDDLRSDVTPILHNTRELFVRVAPRIEDAAADLAAMAHGLRTQTNDVQAAATEVLERLRRQSSRVDSMMSTLLDGVDRAGNFMTDAVAKPMRQLSGLLASVKAVVESLRAAEQPRRDQPAHTPADRDMFI